MSGGQTVAVRKWMDQDMSLLICRENLDI